MFSSTSCKKFRFFRGLHLFISMYHPFALNGNYLIFSEIPFCLTGWTCSTQPVSHSSMTRAYATPPASHYPLCLTPHVRGFFPQFRCYAKRTRAPAVALLSAAIPITVVPCPVSIVTHQCCCTLPSTCLVWVIPSRPCPAAPP
jgi:hypothetical protein